MQGFDNDQLRVRQATTEDARQQNVPAHYNLQFWDPAERPLLLHHIHAVFDPISLGKWIVDWAFYIHDGKSPSAKAAGNLWGLLIHLARKVKLSDKFLSGYSEKPNSERGTQIICVMSDFVQRGEQLIQELQQLLWKCEQDMTEPRDMNAGVLGQFSAAEFVSFFLSRQGYLDRMEEFIQRLRVWIDDWDWRGDGILRLLPLNGQSAAS